ncbi:MAG: methylmalonyl Co-A mutase-associated GTPase MeaB [bacterium]
MTGLPERARAGEVRAVARLITLLEKRDPQAIETLKEIYPHCGRAHVVGVTGPPGMGKSCLISGLIRQLRARERSVGVLAVDPTSPFSGGAILGDRVRMIEQSGDKQVFIRSMASRGAMGGLSAAVNDAVDVLDMAGKDVILVETVGAGQGEIEIARLAHTVILVLMPGCGDTLQAMKAGIMEIGDILVVNKADRPGADETVAELAAIQQFKVTEPEADCWTAPIVRTSAWTGEGLGDLEQAIEKHLRFIRERDRMAGRNRQRRTRQFLDILTQRIRDEFMAELNADPALKQWVRRIGDLELDPYRASDQVIEMIKEARERSRSGGRAGR